MQARCGQLKTILEQILEDVRVEVAEARACCPLAEVRARVADAPPVRSLERALREGGFGILAEIKEKSPSVGPMRAENVREAAAAYAESSLVRGISVLTNRTHFGGSMERLGVLRETMTKPLLRKDFILDEYQIFEARAGGADAVLLMANVLDAGRLSGFFELAGELGLEVLFEIHTEDELEMLPAGARLVGINSRKFKTTEGFSGAERAATKDFSVDLGVFELVGALPPGVLKIAESGLSASTIGRVAGQFDAALIGTSLLRDERGVRAPLEELQAALVSGLVSADL